MAQLDPEPNYDHRLVEWVTLYLQTGDERIFPFTQYFDEERRAAFKRDLRIALSELQDSGSARKTSAVGFIVDDSTLHNIVRAWTAAGGGWPLTSDPKNPIGLAIVD
ncbi:MAG: hypothetical protein IT339_07535 [Thermomicrobiales bacterium]|nr:hypothetical protein [Thermomicrobiales bacterium]